MQIINVKKFISVKWTALPKENISPTNVDKIHLRACPIAIFFLFCAIICLILGNFYLYWKLFYSGVLHHFQLLQEQQEQERRRRSQYQVQFDIEPKSVLRRTKSLSTSDIYAEEGHYVPMDNPAPLTSTESYRSPSQGTSQPPSSGPHAMMLDNGTYMQLTSTPKTMYGYYEDVQTIADKLDEAPTLPPRNYPDYQNREMFLNKNRKDKAPAPPPSPSTTTNMEALTSGQVICIDLYIFMRKFVILH